jgi:hypothetical protein
MQRSDNHFASCLRLGRTAHQAEVIGKATAGRGYVAAVLGNFDRGLEYLNAGLSILRTCDERQEASRVMFEIARIQRLRAEDGWQVALPMCHTCSLRVPLLVCICSAHIGCGY